MSLDQTVLNVWLKTLSRKELEILIEGIKTNDPTLRQGLIYVSEGMTQSNEACAGCLLSYPALKMKAHASGADLMTAYMDKLELMMSKLFRWQIDDFIQWFDNTDRQRVFTKLLPALEAELERRG